MYSVAEYMYCICIRGLAQLRQLQNVHKFHGIFIGSDELEEIFKNRINKGHDVTVLNAPSITFQHCVWCRSPK